MRLEEADIEAIASRVVELLSRQADTPSVRLVDAAQLASVLAVERDWVYEHARELGAIRLGGPHGRLRFDLRQVQRILAEQHEPKHEEPRSAPRRPPRRVSSTPELLPYGKS